MSKSDAEPSRSDRGVSTTVGYAFLIGIVLIVAIALFGPGLSNIAGYLDQGPNAAAASIELFNTDDGGVIGYEGPDATGELIIEGPNGSTVPIGPPGSGPSNPIDQSALEKIQEYAGTGGASEVPYIGDYESIGVVGVTNDTIGPVNQAISSADRSDVQTPREVQTIVDSVINRQDAINTIEEYARTDGSSTQPTVDDYQNAGVTGVTSDNLDRINTAVAATDPSNVNSTSSVQDFVDQVLAGLDRIQTYAETNGKSEAPTASDYNAVGTTGVRDENVAGVNHLIAEQARNDVSTASEIQSYVDQVIAILERIQSHAETDGTSTAPSVSDFDAIGIIGVDGSNLNAVNSKITTVDRSSVRSISQIQALVDSITGRQTAIDKIEQYAQTDGSSTAPTVSDYDSAGVSSVSSSNIDDINSEVAGAAPSEVDSTAEIQGLVDQVVSLIIIQDYAATDGTSQTPIVSDYENISVVGVDSSNIGAINELVSENTLVGVQSPRDVQTVVDKVIESFQTVQAYARTDGDTATPTLEDYDRVSVENVSFAILSTVNQDIAAGDESDFTTSAGIQSTVDPIVTALNRFTEYARQNGASTSPSLADYTTLNLVGMRGKVSQINTEVGTRPASDVNAPPKIQDVIDSVTNRPSALSVIEEYANTNGGSTPPDVATYEDAGVTGVSAGNLADINSAIADSNPAQADTTSDVQTIVDRVTGLAKIQEYARTDGSSAPPAAADFEDVNVVGVTADNQNTVNRAIAAASESNLQTPQDVQKLVNSLLALSVIQEYAKTDGRSQAPTADTYLNAGVTDITDANLAAVNDAIAAEAKSDVPDAAAVQTVVDIVNGALDTVQNYAQSGGATTQPTTNIYDILSVKGVSESVRTDVNNEVASVSRGDVQSQKDIQQLVNRVLNRLRDGIPRRGDDLCAYYGKSIEGKEVQVIYQDPSGQTVIDTVTVSEGTCTRSNGVDPGDEQIGSASGSGTIGVIVN